MDHLFGPVLSRRLGLSMGVDLLTPKICSMDCNYCEIGRTTCLTMQRGRFVSEEKVISEINRSAGEAYDYLTFAGCGEPTLSTSLGRVIKAAKKATDRPVAVITNSSLFCSEKVRAEVAQADLVLPSLDAATQRTFETINRPAPGLRIEDIISGLQAFRKQFGGEIWLEIMLVKNVNEHEAKQLYDAAMSISPERIQLNTVVRPPPEPVSPLSEEEMLDLLDIFEDAEIIPDWDWGIPPMIASEIEHLLLREQTAEDLASSLDVPMKDAIKYLKILEKDGRIRRASRNGKLYFVVG